MIFMKILNSENNKSIMVQEVMRWKLTDCKIRESSGHDKVSLHSRGRQKCCISVVKNLTWQEWLDKLNDQNRYNY